MIPKSTLEVCDPGFNEEDIRASIADSAQSHIKWIYDCLLVRAQSGREVCLSKADRDSLKEVAFDCYKKYVGSYLSDF